MHLRSLRTISSLDSGAHPGMSRLCRTASFTSILSWCLNGSFCLWSQFSQKLPLRCLHDMWCEDHQSVVVEHGLAPFFGYQLEAWWLWPECKLRLKRLWRGSQAAHRHTHQGQLPVWGAVSSTVGGRRDGGVVCVGAMLELELWGGLGSWLGRGEEGAAGAWATGTERAPAAESNLLKKRSSSLFLATSVAKPDCPSACSGCT